MSLGAIARYFKMEANSPGYLTKEQAEDDPEQLQSFSRSDGGNQQDKHLSFHFDYFFTPEFAVSVKLYNQNLERTRWCRFSETGSQQQRFIDDDQYGAVSTITYQTKVRGIKDLVLEGGLDYQDTDSKNQRFYTTDRAIDPNNPNNPNRNWQYTSRYWGAYLKADAAITNWLRLNTGIRLDRFDGDFEDKKNNKKLDMINFGSIWQPKFGLVITPYQGYNLYGNWGRSFQIPAENQRFGDVIGRDVEYSKNDGWEIGTKLSPFDQLAFRLSLWEQTATNEVKLLSDGTGTYGNVGETERKGWDVTLNVKPYAWSTIWGSYTKQEGIYTNPGGVQGSAGTDPRKGKNIENIPEFTAKLGIDLDLQSGFSSSLWLESQGDYYIDQQNTKPRDGSYDVVNMNLSYTWDNMILSLAVKNLFNENYNAFIWNSTYGYSPGDERSYYLSLTMNI